MDLATLCSILLAVLLGGTIFAWANFYFEFKARCPICNPQENKAIWWSKCLWGAVFFTTALVLAVYLKSLM